MQAGWLEASRRDEDVMLICERTEKLIYARGMCAFSDMSSCRCFFIGSAAHSDALEFLVVHLLRRAPLFYARCLTGNILSPVCHFHAIDPVNLSLLWRPAFKCLVTIDVLAAAPLARQGRWLNRQGLHPSGLAAGGRLSPRPW